MKTIEKIIFADGERIKLKNKSYVVILQDKQEGDDVYFDVHFRYDPSHNIVISNQCFRMAYAIQLMHKQGLSEEEAMKQAMKNYYRSNLNKGEKTYDN